MPLTSGIGLGLPAVRGATGGGGPSPPLPGASLWLTTATGMFKTAGGDPAVANDDPVGQWLDQSGNGYGFVQATADRRPLLKTNVQNSLPMVLGDGSNDNLRSADAGLAAVQSGDDTSYTLYLVVKPVNLSAGQENIFGGYNSLTLAEVEFYQQSEGFVYRAQRQDAAAGAGGVTYNPPAGSQDCVLYTVIQNGTTTTIRKNGAQEATGTVNVGTITLNQVVMFASMTGSTNAANYFSGYIGEVLLYPAAHSAGQLTTVEGELMGRWGL